MYKFKKFRRILTFLCSFLVFCTCIGGQFTQVAHATRDSKELQKDLIAMAQKKGIGDISSIDDLTYSDIQILGVFLSNFYVPWQTKINEFSEDDETVKNMTEALVKYCNFDETVAKVIVSAVWKVTMNAKPVQIAKYDVLSSSIGDDVTGHTKGVASYDEFMYYMSGGADGDDNNGEKGSSDYCAYWDDNGNHKIIMESYNNHNNASNTEAILKARISPSALSFAIANGGVEYNKGVGSAITSKESRQDAEAVDAKDSKGMVTGWGVYVDSFGNLLVDTDDGQYVILPACMNAYTWTTNGRAGQSIPLVNLLCIANTFEGDVSSSVSDVRIRAHTKSNGSGLQYQLGLSGALFETETKWAGWRNFDDLDQATDFVTGVINRDTKLNEMCNKRGLKYSDRSWDGSRWYFPNWADIFQAIANAGGMDYNFTYIDDLILINDVGSFSGDSNPVFNKNETGIFSNKTEEYDDNDNDKIEDDEYYYKPLADKSAQFGSANYYTMKNGAFRMSSSEASKYMLGIYVSYVLAYSGSDIVGYGFNKDGLPPIDASSLVFTSGNIVKDNSSQVMAIQNEVYWLLHPVQGIRYVKQLFKKWMSSILVGIHQDIVGSGNKANLGITKYVGFSGYVTTPELNDLSWTSAFVDKYTSMYIYLVILVMIILVGYVMVGSMTLPSALVSLCMFSVCAFFPPYLIDATISKSNEISSAIYGEKFMYWALVENQAYVTEIDNNATSNYSDYLLTLYKNQNAWADDTSNSVAIALKWMCPKKNNYMYSVNKELERTSTTGLNHLLKGMFQKRLSYESFSRSDDANYLFRSYSDISNYSKYLYKQLKLHGLNDVSSSLIEKSGIDYGKVVEDITEANKRGFSVLSADDNNNIHWKAILTTDELGKAIGKNFKDVTTSSYFGIEQKVIDYDLNSINGASSKLGKGGLYAYAQYSESPFYFFSWNFYDQGMSTDKTASGTFKDLVLGNKTGGKDSYFYNTVSKSGGGAGSVRDFLDMRSLFTVVIPELRKANEMVEAWDDKYGMEIFDGVSCDPSATYDGDPKNAGDREDWEYKHWHNVNVAQLWNMYTPWVDTMYDCDYSQPAKITVAGKKFLVSDPLDPSTYPGKSAGRPMIFSKSEQAYYGLSDADLTIVERKILQVQDDTMDDFYKLMNYYSFNDTVMNTASAMITTFNFNKAFSQTSVLGKSYTLYPQSFELKNFSFDAYLRLILANTTGESLSGTDDMYTTVVYNSSVVTGVLLVINDILVTYPVSGLKLFFLLGIFIMSVLMIVAGTIRLDLKLSRTIWECLCKPLVKFLAVSVAHAYTISLFMSDGNLNVTGETSTSISVGDPALVLCLLMLINCIVIYLYFRIVRGVVKNVIKFTKAVTHSVSGMAGSVVAGNFALSGLSAGDSTGGSSSLRSSFRRKNRSGKDASMSQKAGHKSTFGDRFNGFDKNKQGGLSTADIESKRSKGKSNINKRSGSGSLEREKADSLETFRSKLPWWRRRKSKPPVVSPEERESRKSKVNKNFKSKSKKNRKKANKKSRVNKKTKKGVNSKKKGISKGLGARRKK